MKQNNFKATAFYKFYFTHCIYGLTAHADFSFKTPEVSFPLFLSSLPLIDVTYVSSCNIRENKNYFLFCGLLALESWYILLVAWATPSQTLFFSL